MHPILETFEKEGRMHHGYLIVGDIDKNLSALRGAIEKIIAGGIDGYPDYYVRFASPFSVDDSRELIERQKTMSFGGGPRFFVIGSRSFTAEAQNGLLKVLEEPLADNHFFVLVANEEILLPALRSRLFMLRGEESTHGEIEGWCRRFIAADLTNRVAMIEKFLKDEDSDEDKNTKHRTADALSRIEKIFADKIAEGRSADNLAAAGFLSELVRMKGYLNDIAPNVRLILEYIAFICPPL